MVRPRVLLDCDGVLADFITPACETMNKILGSSVTPNDMKSWYLFDAFDFEVLPETREACYDQWKRPGWCFDLKPYPGAQEGVALLREVADVYIVTTPMEGATWADERRRWLTKYFGFDRKTIVHTDGKYICSGDVFVDDKRDHCRAWKACHPLGTAILWECVTNRTQDYEGIKTGDWGKIRTIAESHDLEGLRQWKHRAI